MGKPLLQHNPTTKEGIPILGVGIPVPAQHKKVNSAGCLVYKATLAKNCGLRLSHFTELVRMLGLRLPALQYVINCDLSSAVSASALQ